MKAAVMLLGLVLGTNYGYLAWPTKSEQRWHFYVATGLSLSALFLMELQRARHAVNRKVAGLWAYACWLGAIEGAQVAGCGVLRWRQPSELDLCLAVAGHGTYGFIAALALAAVLARKWGAHG